MGKKRGKEKQFDAVQLTFNDINTDPTISGAELIVRVGGTVIRRVFKPGAKRVDPIDEADDRASMYRNKW